MKGSWSSTSSSLPKLSVLLLLLQLLCSYNNYNNPTTCLVVHSFVVTTITTTRTRKATNGSFGIKSKQDKATTTTTHQRIASKSCTTPFQSITLQKDDAKKCRRSRTRTGSSLQMSQLDNDNNNNKFGMTQRIDSLKSLVVGAVVGSIALVPLTLIHDLYFSTYNGLSQFEFDIDTGAIQSGLFAIIYRYVIRQDTNEQLNMGVVGAFCIVRTVSRIIIPSYCTPIVLNCGPPFGYLDYNVLFQLLWNGSESICLYGVTAIVMDYCMKQQYISKFPN